MKAIDIQERLKVLTGCVREMKGEKEALIFYVNYIQPIKRYFKEKHNIIID